MAGLLDNMRGWYNYSMANADPRVYDLPLLQNPGPMLTIVATYVLVCLWGPRFMENRKPMQLKWVIVPYNFIMVAYCFMVFYRTAVVSFVDRYSLVCQEVDHSNSQAADEAITIGWLFFFAKIIELADTIFFILRKKNSQITFLHVYHHATIVIATWSGLKWVPGGQSFIHPLINSFVHVVMYIYYGMAAIGPHMQKYLWWKRYLTMLQLTQFVLMLTHCTVNLMVPDCKFPKLFSLIVIGYAFSVMLLFLNFYFRAYIQKSRPSKGDKSQ